LKKVLKILLIGLMKVMTKKKFSVIGIGYVGLPLAVALSRNNKIVGFDTNINRVKGLQKGNDITKEFKKNDFIKNKNLIFTNKEAEIKNSDVFFITVPTPINNKNKPNLDHLEQASKTVARNIKKNSIVVFESTVYPGCTEEICLPILEKFSRLKANKDFYLAYSPERINPGKSKYKLKNTIKVLGSSNKKTTFLLSKIYKKICLGVHVVRDIKTAEAAKIIENTQRDLNIALINELSIIFKKMNLDINKILKAASTKWNFINFQPGLVGGHCIGVDPYYLTFKSEKLNYKPKVILAGRKINDSMSHYVGKNVFSLLKKKKTNSNKILILGAAFKENCSDLRNSKIFDTIKFLEKKGATIYIYDPLVPNQILKKYVKKVLTKLDRNNFFDAAIISVKHEKFKKLGVKKIRKNLKKDGLIFDLKSVFLSSQVDWTL
tara:strand:+ start:1098 stop:2402 length:1305 start_codon:yes stop_codon:yes gene_type:complete